MSPRGSKNFIREANRGERVHCLTSFALRAAFGRLFAVPAVFDPLRFGSCPFFEVAEKPRREEADRSVRAPPDGLGLRMILLEGADLDLASLEGFDGSEGGVGAAEGGHDGDAVLHGGGADFDFVFAGVFAAGGVDDEGHVFVFHQVDDIGALAAGEFGEDVHGDVGFADDAAGAAGGVALTAI